MPKKSCEASPTKVAPLSLKVIVPSLGEISFNPAEKIGLKTPFTCARPILRMTGNFEASVPEPNCMVDLIWKAWTVAFCSLTMPIVWLIILKAGPTSQFLMPTSTPPISQAPFLYLSLESAKITFGSVGSRLGKPALSVLSTFTVSASKVAGLAPSGNFTLTPPTSSSKPAKAYLKASIPPVKVRFSVH